MQRTLNVVIQMTHILQNQSLKSMIKAAKDKLRKTINTQLATQDHNEINKASATICKRITDTLSPPENIAIFSAHGPEIDLSSLHQLCPDSKLLYPLCQSPGVISYHHVASPSELAIGKYGILEPDPAKHPEVTIPDIDMFFCPGLAFGKDGSRLGHGGGYYDRALAKRSTSREVLICAVALDQQVFDTLPCEDHDIKMHQIITEKQSYHCHTC